MMEFSIRRATIHDLAEINEIENLAFVACDRFSSSQFKYLLTKANSISLVCINSNKIIGYIIALFRKNSHVVRIYSVAVHNSHRNRGIAGLLFSSLENIAVKMNFKIASLEVRGNKEDLISIYKKFGYQQYSIHDNYYSDGMSAIKMKKIIG